MIIQDVINLARHSELAGTAIKNNDDVILLFVNAGMTELYKRFPICTKEHIVHLSEAVTMYELPVDFMYVMSAYDEIPETSGGGIQEIPINNEEDEMSIFFPDHRHVQVPLVANNTSISLIYVAKPPYYTAVDINKEIDLPEVLIDCLLHYIGYKAHLGIRGDGQAETNAHYVRFERSCDKARELGIGYSVDSLQTAGRLAQRGFV